MTTKSGFSASPRSWISFSLHYLGVDATLDEVNKFISRWFSGIQVSEREWQMYRDEVIAEEPGKPYTKADRLYHTARELCFTKEGRMAVKLALRLTSESELREILNLERPT